MKTLNVGTSDFILLATSNHWCFCIMDAVEMGGP